MAQDQRAEQIIPKNHRKCVKIDNEIQHSEQLMGIAVFLNQEKGDETLELQFSKVKNRTFKYPRGAMHFFDFLTAEEGKEIWILKKGEDSSTSASLLANQEKG